MNDIDIVNDLNPQNSQHEHYVYMNVPVNIVRIDPCPSGCCLGELEHTEGCLYEKGGH